MPELPEMQALAERLDALLAGATLRRADLLGFSSLKTYAPTPEDLYGHQLQFGRPPGQVPRLRRFEGGSRMVLHLSQAGRLDIEEPPKKTKPRGAVARFTFTTAGESPSTIAVLVREYGTQRKASWWMLAPGDEGPLAGLGPEPGSEEFATLIRTSDSRRHLTTDLRDQHVVSGIGRGWGDDILQRAKLSPFASLRSLTPEQREALLAAATDVLAEALELERGRAGGRAEAQQGGRVRVPDRFGEPCPTPCGDTLRRVSFESYEMAYCPTCQTGGKVLADRRLSACSSGCVRRCAACLRRSWATGTEAVPSSDVDPPRPDFFIGHRPPLQWRPPDRRFDRRDP